VWWREDGLMARTILDPAKVEFFIRHLMNIIAATLVGDLVNACTTGRLVFKDLQEDVVRAVLVKLVKDEVNGLVFPFTAKTIDEAWERVESECTRRGAGDAMSKQSGHCGVLPGHDDRQPHGQ